MTQTAETGAVAETVGEGQGLAAVDWRAAVEKLLLKAAIPLEPQVRRIALNTVQDLIGFYVLWHAEGGFAGLQRLGMPRATIYRKINLFRESFGQHPDVREFAWLDVNAEKYLEEFGLPEGAEVPRVLALGREGPMKLPR